MKRIALFIGISAVLAAFVIGSVMSHRQATPVRSARALTMPLPASQAWLDPTTGALLHSPPDPDSLLRQPPRPPVAPSVARPLPGGGIYAEYDLQLAPRMVATIDEDGNVVVDCVVEEHGHHHSGDGDNE